MSPSPDVVDRALADTRPTVFWLDNDRQPDQAPALLGDHSTDLAVVGGGYAGLWTALLAKERDPARDVTLLEARTCGWAASGRNGGFCVASLTHGFPNGWARWPAQMPTLTRLGEENLSAIEAATEGYQIQCGFERTGELAVATTPWQADELRQQAGARSAAGHDVELLDTGAVRAEIASPTYLVGLWEKRTTALVDPAALAWGLRRAVLALGVRVFESSAVRSLAGGPNAITLSTQRGKVSARRVVLATNAFPSLLRRTRLFTVPVYDYALVTEPLTAEQLASVGWRNRQGVGDAANLFHYYRLTADNRVLWGGYDAIYHFGSRIRDELGQRPRTFRVLAGNFFRTFPQLEGIRFSHAWGGVIDTCSRFCAFYGTAHGGRVAYAAGYTGLGVGATRFAADVTLDLVSGQDTERTRLEMVRRRPIPFPPEPLRSAGIQATRWSLARADRQGGRRNLWLRLLDRAGLGFDS